MKSAFIIAPSGKISKEQLENALNNLKKFNFKAKFLPNILDAFFYYAGSPNRRARELNLAYSDKENEYIFCVRGGKGAIHIVSSLDYKVIKKTNKILIGYSDITLLLNAIYQKTGKRCLHGPNLGKRNTLFNKKTINCLFDAITKKDYSVKIKEKDVFIPGYVKAKIVGGNISLLERSLGTKFEIETKDKILFLEENDKKGRLIYDVLWQLKLAGKFSEVKGIILGHFTECDKDTKNYLLDFFKDFNCPVIINQPIGHAEPNLTIPIGETCIINTEKGYWGIRF